MKKTFLLTIFSGIFLILSFMTSCLGDGGDSYVIRNGELAYVKSTTTGIPYAYALSSYVKVTDYTAANSEVAKLRSGNFYIIDFKITTDMTSDGIYLAEYVKVHESPKPVAQNEILFNEKPYSNLINRNDTITPVTMGLYSADFEGSTLDNKWVIYYTINRRTDDKVTAYFYYDEENQEDEDGNGIPDKNKIIIDIRFAITEKGSSTSTVNEQTYAAVDLSQLRYRYPYLDYKDADSEGVLNVPVKLRYQRYTTASQPASVETLGSWTPTQNNYYYFIYKK